MPSITEALKAVALGGLHTCATLDKDMLKCWGYNSVGQLGYGDVSHRGDGAGEMGDSLAQVDLGTGRSVKAVALGHYRTCSTLYNDMLKCVGLNNRG